MTNGIASHAAWERTSDPETEPITTAEAKAHLREDGSDSDDLIDALIVAARQFVEEYTGRAVITQTWQYVMDAIPCGLEVIRLPRPPLQSVTTFQYVDGDGATQTWASSNYRVDLVSEPGRITLASGALWPTPQYVSNSVIVTYVAGYGDEASDVPDAIRQAMLLLIGSWYANRESEVVGTVVGRLSFAVDALLEPYKVHGF